MDSMEFTYLRPIGMSACALQEDAYAAARLIWRCTGCGSAKPSVGAVDVDIEEKRPPDAPMTFLHGSLIILAHRDLLDTLRSDHVQADLMLGIVRNSSGKVLPDWATVRGRRRLIVRGSENASHRRCQVCNRHFYHALGEKYLFPTPAVDTFIFESDGCLVVRPETVDKGGLEGWPKLDIVDLKVLPEPRDGLGDLIQV
jgi:hypothetical protein